MSSNTNTSRYKQVNRQARIQTREGAFSKGMMYTDKPLTEGYSKTLVNYAIDPVDGSLNVQKGLKTTIIGDGSTHYPAPYRDSSSFTRILDERFKELFPWQHGYYRVLNAQICTRPAITAYYVNEQYDHTAIAGTEKVIQALVYNTVTKALLIATIPFSKEHPTDITREQIVLTPFSQGAIVGYRDDSDFAVVPNSALDTHIPIVPIRQYSSTLGQRLCHNFLMQHPTNTFAFDDSIYTFTQPQYYSKYPDNMRKSVGGTYSPFSSGLIITTATAPENSDAVVTADGTAGANLQLDVRTGVISCKSGYGLNIVKTPTLTSGNNPLTPANYFTQTAFGNSVDLRNYLILPENPEVGYAIAVSMYASWEYPDNYTSNNPYSASSVPPASVRNYVEISYTWTGSRWELNLGESRNSRSFLDYMPELSDIGHTYVHTAPSVLSYSKIADKTNFQNKELHLIDATHPYTLDDLESVGAYTVPKYPYCFEHFTVSPRVLNPSEAVTAGFNMLLENPYAFNCTRGANITLLGLLPYADELATVPLLRPIINQDILLKCYWRAPDSEKLYHVIWEWREVGATAWNIAQDTKVAFNSLMPLQCAFRSAVEQLIIKVTIKDPENTVQNADGSVEENIVATLPTGLYFNISNEALNGNTQPTKYQLNTATGMLCWKNRLVLWGVKDASSTLFCSAVNDPTYFPYPTNVEVLSEPILHVMSYGDSLILVTPTKFYRYALNSDGTTTTSLVQQNLNISPADIPYFIIYKTLLFFKSGGQFYMLVPKSTSLTGDTTIAPVSRSIVNLLDNFSTEIYKVCNYVTQNALITDTQHPYPFTDYLVSYGTLIDNERIVVRFIYDLASFRAGHLVTVPYTTDYTYDKGFVTKTTAYHSAIKDAQNVEDYLVVDLQYDPALYSWTICVQNNPTVLTSLNIVASDSNINIGPYFVQRFNSMSMDHSGGALQLAQTSNTVKNLLIKSVGSSGNTPQYFDNTIKAYQYLDTGYRVLTGAVDIKKRFREVQFSINNISQKALTFYTAFIVDGNLRKDMKGYTTKMLVDPDDPRTGVLLVERPYIDERYLPSVPDYVIQVEDYVSPDITPGDTTLNDTFILDNTQFPDLAYWKVRVAISGKGYVPRLQILSINEQPYNILSTNWVYRTMNSR